MGALSTLNSYEYEAGVDRHAVREDTKNIGAD